MAVVSTLSLLLAAGPVIVTGDITTTRAVLWAEAPGANRLEVWIDGPDGPQAPRDLGPGGPVFKAVLADLHPGSEYRLKVCAGSLCSAGRLRTAPDSRANKSVRIAFSGDLAGQNACRDRESGFPVFAAMKERQPDLFVALGDMVYADAQCKATGRFGNAQIPGPGPAYTYEEFAAHWRYTRADPAYRSLLASTPLFAVWDDHEVINDFSPRVAERSGRPLFEPGRRAMRDYNPIDRGGNRLYGRFRWGRHAELFLLDTRSYRDHKDVRDDGAKTMLGEEQRDWFVAAVTGSDATWKIVATSVPLAVPTGWPAGEGRDSWADAGEPTGYEEELSGLVDAFAGAGVRNLVWIAADVHFATAFRHTPIPDRPEFFMLEAVAGPLAAGLFPHRDLDRSLRPRRLFFHGPEPADTDMDFRASLHWMNFGLLDIEADGRLILRYVNALGEELTAMDFAPVSHPSSRPANTSSP